MIITTFGTILTLVEYEGIGKGVCLVGDCPRLSAEVLLACAHRGQFSNDRRAFLLSTQQEAMCPGKSFRIVSF